MKVVRIDEGNFQAQGYEKLHKPVAFTSEREDSQSGKTSAAV